jgi:uncharacterized membrane protein
VDAVIGLAFYLAIVAVGLASILAMTIWAGRASANRGRLTSVAVPVGAFLVAFMGGWLIFDTVLLVRLAHRRLARSGGSS